MTRRDSLRESYDRVAGEYAKRIYGELAAKPRDRELLDRFARTVRGSGPVCDLGCGPGQIARYLKDRGVVEVFGIDLSPGMVERARELNPDLEFQTGDMTALSAPDATWAGIAAFYSIIHVPRDELPTALREMQRVLRPGAPLLLSFHVGDEDLHLDEWWEQPVSVDFLFHTREEMERALRDAGFEIEEVVERDPYPDVETQTRRAYVFAVSDI